MSDTSDTDQAQAEPVDAEFEPAPGTSAKSKTTKPRKSGPGLPWLTIAVVTVSASSIGGGTGWLIGRYAPDANDNALQERLVALEAATDAATQAATQAVSDSSGLNALQSRLTTLENQLTAAQLRAEGLEAVIRDLAALRGRVETLEAEPAQAEPTTTEDGNNTSDLAALENRLNVALAAIDERFETVVRGNPFEFSQLGDNQRVLQQQLLDLTEAFETYRAENATEDDAAPSAAITQIESRIAALEGALASLLNRVAAIDALETAVTDLTSMTADQTGSSSGAIDDLAARVSALEEALTQLNEAEENADPIPTLATPALAERALAFAAVSRAAAGSEPFPVAVADLQRLWPSAPGSAALTAPARTGAPTLDQLVASFPADAIRAATGESQMWLGVIRVEREGTSGPTPAIEAALAEGNLAGAVAAVRALEDEARSAAATWLTEAEARLTIEESLIALAEALSRAEEQG